MVHAEIQAFLDRAVPLLRRSLGDEIVAIYLWGSATLGGYRPGLSDVDVMVCLRTDPSDAALSAVAPVHAMLVGEMPEWSNRIEVAYVGIDSLQHFRDAPHQIARISPGEPLNLRMADGEWLIDWYQVREHGRSLVGPPAAGLLPGISIEEFRSEAARQVRQWRDRVPTDASTPYLAYIVLAITRGLHAWRTGSQVSKQDAGMWLAEERPDWRVLASAAVAQQASHGEIDGVVLKGSDVSRFARWAADLVASGSSTRPDRTLTHDRDP